MTMCSKWNKTIKTFKKRDEMTKENKRHTIVIVAYQIWQFIIKNIFYKPNYLFLFIKRYLGIQKLQKYEDNE